MRRLLLVLILVLVAVPALAKNVTLSWDASPSADVAGYKVYIGGSEAPPFAVANSPIDVGNVLTYTVPDLQGDQDYYFAVTAYDAAENESTYSNIVVSKALDEIAPGAPENLQQVTVKVIVTVSSGAE